MEGACRAEERTQERGEDALLYGHHFIIISLPNTNNIYSVLRLGLLVGLGLPSGIRPTARIHWNSPLHYNCIKVFLPGNETNCLSGGKPYRHLPDCHHPNLSKSPDSIAVHHADWLTTRSSGRERYLKDSAAHSSYSGLCILERTRTSCRDLSGNGDR